MRSQAADRGEIVPRCVPRLPTVARLCPDAFPKGPRTGKTPVRGNISPPCIQIQLILARYACYVSKKPRKVPLGNTPCEHLAAKGRFRRPKPPDHARRTNLATLRWPCPCAGAPARATASRDRLSTAWPLRRDACPSAPPMPATRQYLPLAVPVAVSDKPPMDFGGDHSAHGLQFGQAPRDRRLHHLDGQADNGMLRRTGPELQNREQVGAEPPAEAAGPAGPASALPKTPIERTNPSWRNYRNTASISHCAKKPTPGINPRVSFICVLSCIQPVRVSSCFTLGSFSAGCHPFFRLAPAAQQRFGASKLAVASLRGTTFRQSASPARRLTLAARYWTSAFHRPCRLQYSYTATGSSPGTTAKSALGSSPGWRCFTWKPFEVSSTIMVMK